MLEAQRQILPGDITCFAETNFRNQKKKFGIKSDDRRRHMYLIGKTGMGKTTCMENMIVADIAAGRGVALVDPHGDFAERLLNFIPNHRINDVVYFNPGDIEYPIAFNILECLDQNTKHLVSSGLIGIFKKLWADTWGPRLEYLLRNTVLALMDYPGSTLLGIMRMLVDKNYRKKVIDKIKDPVVKSFWVDEYSKYHGTFQVEAINPIQNKVGQFLSNSLTRNIVGQVKSSIDIRDIMDNKKILIMNLSKGRIGEDVSSLLGAMMITKIQLAAMERIDTPEEQRKDFYLYVDEFQNFATESFANILSEARKYRLNLIMAHQYIEQLDEMVQGAVFGNVGTIIAFRVGAVDAEALAKEFAPYVLEEDLVSLTKYESYLKLMIDGVSSTPFSATVLPPVSSRETNEGEKIIKISRERYAKQRTVIEDKIARWTGMMEDTGVEKKESQTKEKIKKRNEGGAKIQVTDTTARDDDTINYKVRCDSCGKETAVSFKPDGVRPVYCKNCLKTSRLESEQAIKSLKKEIPPATTVKPISLREAMHKKPITFSSRKINHREAEDINEQDKNKSGTKELKPDNVVKI